MVHYDKEYQTADLFGKPYKEFVEFFKNYSPKGTVLDLGCGQGRDSLALAKLGYTVTGVDVSKVGISQMFKKAKKSKVKVNGMVDDFFKYKPKKKYDVIILDSVIQFYKNAKEKETKFLLKILEYVKTRGLVCIFIHKSIPREKYLKSIFEKLNSKFEIIIDRHIDFVWEDKASNHKSEMQFKMVFARKL